MLFLRLEDSCLGLSVIRKIFRACAHIGSCRLPVECVPQFAPYPCPISPLQSTCLHRGVRPLIAVEYDLGMVQRSAVFTFYEVFLCNSSFSFPFLFFCSRSPCGFLRFPHSPPFPCSRFLLDSLALLCRTRPNFLRLNRCHFLMG